MGRERKTSRWRRISPSYYTRYLRSHRQRVLSVSRETSSRPETGFHETKSPETGTETGFPETGFPETGFPETGFPKTEFTETGFQTVVELEGLSPCITQIY